MVFSDFFAVFYFRWVVEGKAVYGGEMMPKSNAQVCPLHWRIDDYTPYASNQPLM